MRALGEWLPASDVGQHPGHAGHGVRVLLEVRDGAVQVLTPDRLLLVLSPREFDFLRRVLWDHPVSGFKNLLVVQFLRASGEAEITG